MTRARSSQGVVLLVVGLGEGDELVWFGGSGPHVVAVIDGASGIEAHVHTAR